MAHVTVADIDSAEQKLLMVLTILEPEKRPDAAGAVFDRLRARALDGEAKDAEFRRLIIAAFRSMLGGDIRQPGALYDRIRAQVYGKAVTA